MERGASVLQLTEESVLGAPAPSPQDVSGEGDESGLHRKEWLRRNGVSAGGLGSGDAPP